MWFACDCGCPSCDRLTTVIRVMCFLHDFHRPSARDLLTHPFIFPVLVKEQTDVRNQKVKWSCLVGWCGKHKCPYKNVCHSFRTFRSDWRVHSSPSIAARTLSFTCTPQLTLLHSLLLPLCKMMTVWWRSWQDQRCTSCGPWLEEICGWSYRRRVWVKPCLPSATYPGRKLIQRIQPCSCHLQLWGLGLPCTSKIDC